MDHNILKSFATALLLLIGISSVAVGQRNRTTANASLLSTLPPSDAVAVINLSRVFNEAMPKLLAENPAKLSEINAELEKFKTRTGL
ncbi:MAG TPA: hypothetical protein VGN90_03605, partial [Pyrinomonadaceae bacterium]|nr:hypothetical protein [Pyrinomonadaceae bacterium]